jgi:hypothetical protein
MRKQIPLGSMLILLGMFTYGCATSETQPVNESTPEIIDVFACGDNCPGPKEKYMVKAYKGINNEADCLKLGGRPYVYEGWGKHFVCIVQ